MNLLRSRAPLLVVALLAACSGRYSDLLEPNDITTTIAPSLTKVCIGDTAALRMAIAGQPIWASVAWRSDNVQVATVDQTGIVHVIKGGDVTIRAMLAADTNVKATMFVSAKASLGTAASFQWIRVSGTSTPANINALRGAIDILVSTPARRDCYVSPTWTRAELRVGAPDGTRDSTVAVLSGGRIDFDSQVQFTFDTAALPNGEYQLSVRYVDPVSHLSESSARQAFTIQNP